LNDVNSADWDAHRLSFGPAAALYDRVRPRYPVEALRWLLRDQPTNGQCAADQPANRRTGRLAERVVDLGAGTGILTRQLVELGHEVVAVEPDPDMRAQLAKSQPGIAIDGSAERIPLPDGDADAVVAGQSYHWFDRPRAHEEIARVLRNGGVFAPLWNVRDEEVRWLAQLTALMDGVTEGANGFDERRIGADGFGHRFGPVAKAEFRFSLPYTVDGLIELMRSRSHYLAASRERQRQVEREVRRLAGSHPALATGATFPVPYVTHAYRATKLG
jgi:SAM-dependent methyltransferase